MGMTDRDRKVLMAVLALLAVAGMYFMLIRPKMTAVSEANTAKQEAQTALDTANQAEAAAKAVKLEKPEHYAKLIRLGAAIPTDDDFASLLVQIDGLSLDNDVSLRDLQVSAGGAGAGPTAAVGGTSCDDTGATGATAVAAPAPTPAAGATGSTAQTFVGKSKDKAKDAAADAEARNAAAQLEACAAAPSLADLSAKAAGLATNTYMMSFRGSFFDLDTFFGKLLGMVSTHNGKVKVKGRLLDITQINLSVTEFPQLSANVQLTGYTIPPGGIPTAAPPAAAPPAGTPAANTGE